MQLIELQTFLAIVETGSLVRASEKLNVTQSTVTARLKSLENELGQTLIVRNKSGASLTASGEKLRRYANTISDLWRQARQETALPDALSSVCNVGCEPDLWAGIAQPFFERLRTELPKVAISIWQGSHSELSKWLRGGLIDVSFTYTADVGQLQSAYPLHVDKLVLVSSEPKSAIKFDPDYVFVEAGEDFGRDHAIAYSDANTARVSFGNATLGLEHLLKNGGSAYLPKRLVEPSIKEGRLFVLEEAPTFERQIHLVATKSVASSWPWFEEAVTDLRTKHLNSV